jgi:diguanylate cyclase (GGDEF)-like protein
MKAIIENAQKQDLLQEDIERAKKIFNFNTIIQEATTLEGASESILNVFSSFCSAKSIFFTIWNSISEDFEIIGGLGKDATEAKRIKHHEGDDLISLSIKLNRPLPENGVFRENIQSVISGARFPWVKDGDPFLVVPFVLKSIPLGAVIIVGLKDFSFTKEIVDCAKSIAMVASNSLHSLKIYEILEKRAVTDELTGLYNKRNFLMRLDEVFADSIRHNKLFSLLIGDLDYFKKINDEYGHITGDRVLKAAAMIIKETARKSDIVARYGGEEFAVIIPETDIDGGKAAAERIRQALERTKVPGPTSLIDISISFGIASFPKDGRNTQEIIGKADKALYKAKKEGRNRVCV